MARRGLDSVIRLQKWRLDEKRRQLGDLLRLSEQLQGELAGLENELQAEQELVAGNFDASYNYGAYARGYIERRERLQQSLQNVEQQIEAAQEEVRAAFRELKTIEITKDNRDKVVAIETGRRQQSELDELSLNPQRRAMVGRGI
jgi:flagellar export protein FliJ